MPVMTKMAAIAKTLWLNNLLVADPTTRDNNCDAIKQNESEVEKYDFCFVFLGGIFY